MLSPAQLKSAARKHMEIEYRVQVDHIMDTVSSHPVWILDPVFRIEGRAAVTEMYRRALPAPGQKEMTMEAMAALDDPEVTAWGESHFVIEFSNAPARYPLHKGCVLTVHFDEELLASERVYITDPQAAARIRSFFGPDFDKLPGVHSL